MPRFTKADLEAIQYLDDALLLHMEQDAAEQRDEAARRQERGLNTLLFKLAHGDVTKEDLEGLLGPAT